MENLEKILEEVKAGTTSLMVARIRIRTLNLQILRATLEEMKTSNWSELSELLVEKWSSQ